MWAFFDDRTAAGVDAVPPAGGAVASLRSPLRPSPGVTVALTAATFPDLFVSVTRGRPVLVLGLDGEPFAQIGAADPG